MNLELQQAVEEVTATIPIKMLCDAAQNVHKCAQACIEASEDHFKHFVRSILKTTTLSSSVQFINLKYSENIPRYVVFLCYSSRVKPCSTGFSSEDTR